MARKFYHKILGFLAVFRRRFRGIWGSTRGEGAFLTLRRGSSGRFEAHPGTPVPSASDFPPFLTTENTHPRGSRGPDASDRRSGRVDRNDPGRIRSALNRAGSGQAGHGPWEQVLI